jgi:hypothetical protein
MSINQGEKGNFQARGNTLAGQFMNDPDVQVAQQGAQQAVEFQLWTAQQAMALSKLKVFASMAKSINDQS